MLALQVRGIDSVWFQVSPIASFSVCVNFSANVSPDGVEGDVDAAHKQVGAGEGDHEVVVPLLPELLAGEDDNDEDRVGEELPGEDDDDEDKVGEGREDGGDPEEDGDGAGVGAQQRLQLSLYHKMS